MTEAMRTKQRAIDLLRNNYDDDHRKRLADVDERLAEYFDHICMYSSADPDDENDVHNVYEVLGAVKFLRMFDAYPFNKKKVQKVIRLREGVWKRDGKVMRHVDGGLKCPGDEGDTVYRWEPFQVFVLASTFGFYTWVNTEIPAGTKAKLRTTERERDGYIYDYRRLCTHFTYFGPRKTDKTGLSAYIQFIFFFFEDFNAECYCAANRLDQSKLLFSRTRALISQMESGDMIRSTQTVIDWRDAFKGVHNSKVEPLSAGGKLQDGYFAQLLCDDETGNAEYTNGNSNLLSVIKVIMSSMGPRREPMRFTTTTAGTVKSGPFRDDELPAMHKMLLAELDIADGKMTPTIQDDRWLCLCLEPDEWEYDEEVILTKKSLRRKVNPMLGLIAQHSSYDERIAEARKDRSKMDELISKFFNHYVSGDVKRWAVTPDEIRKLQKPLVVNGRTIERITDCLYSEGWSVFIGLDFSGGDDLFAMSLLAVNYSPGLEMSQRFFADTYLWILESALQKSPNRQLFEKLIEQGWMRKCPGKVFNSDYAINELMSLHEKGINLRMFGYDPAQSHDPINTIKAWLQSLNISNEMIKEMVIPVPQSAMNMNPLVQKVEHMTLASEPWLSFSGNPMWPWMFGNVVLVYSRDGTLCRPQKSGDHKKIDGVAALLDALAVFDISESK